jgi:SPASM domain peptide maturase of grasp-with-spasm system
MSVIPNDKPFKLFPCCILVKGYTKSILYDLNRNSYWYIPHDLHNLIVQYEGKPLDFVYSEARPEDKKTIAEYFRFLNNHEFILFADSIEELGRFTKLDTSYFAPSHITNAIIQIDNEAKVDMKKVVEDLTELGCRDVQLVFHSSQPLEKIGGVLNHFENSAFRSIELLIRYNNNNKRIKLSEMVDKFKRISRLVIYCSPNSEVIKPPHFSMQEIISTNHSITEELYSPIMNEGDFSVNMGLFCESQNFNTYLNRKIVIAPNGDIKNAPNSKAVYGNFNFENLSDIVNKKEFQELWSCKKDLVEICKDCEYRHMCVDNRVPIKREGKWTHETSCLYDVYSGKWKK